ncbi:MAG: hypothetical protein U0166_25135 [Acidobacteriota bacterium]
MTALSGMRPIVDFDGLASIASPGARLDEIRRVTPRFRDRFASEGAATALRTLPLATFPYPQKYGLGYVSLHPAPYAMISHRCHLVRYRDWDGVPRTLLFNPTDTERAKAAPFFAQLIAFYGSAISEGLLSTTQGSVLQHLSWLSLPPEAIDYIAFDHLHVQDLRGWLSEGLLPRAILLVQERELRGAQRLHPLQCHWYVPGGVDGLDPDRVLLLRGDVSLGPGVALLATPGHTWGNHTLAVHHGGGRVTCVSENGISADNYAPRASRIPGLARHARERGVEVVMNANTLEGSLDQYTSMVKEQLVAGPLREAPDFYDVMPSSELTMSLLALGLRATFEHREVAFGDLG